ncbi:hypothetical protein ACLOJK_033744 [Asimina triloba]
MGKFSVVHKEKRAQSAAWKRAIHGDPNTRKLKQKPQPLAISGKRKRKLFKKWRRVWVSQTEALSSPFFHPSFTHFSFLGSLQEQKEALQKGLVTMQDVEMAIADEKSDIGIDRYFIEILRILNIAGGLFKLGVRLAIAFGKSRKKATKATEDTIGVENADVTSDAAAAPHAANADAMQHCLALRSVFEALDLMQIDLFEVLMVFQLKQADDP